MKSRYERGLTDMRHRYRMMAHHSWQIVPGKKRIYRLVVGKKSRYFYAGLYTVKQWNNPDVCVYYTDTRRYLSEPRDKRYELLAKDLFERMMPLASKSTAFCIDKGRRKNLQITHFTENIKRLCEGSVLTIHGCE